MLKQSCILVIDDEESIRDACSQALIKDGYKVQTASDGGSGVEMINKIKPDMLLVDIKMPGLSGIEVLKKAGLIDSDLICVVITGYGTVELAVEAMKLNAYDFIAKPFTPGQLRVVVKDGIDKRKALLESERIKQEKQTQIDNFEVLISHQLRSPLTSAKQDFEVILSGLTGELNRKQKDLLCKADKRLDGLIDITNSLLNIARIGSGKIMENIDDVDLPDLINSIINSLKPFAARKQVEINTKFSQKCRLIKGSWEALKQAFLNIISNSIKYNKRSGTVEIDIKEREKYVVIEIKDTGIGISREQIPFIFDKFFRVKTEQTLSIRGTGLGLAIARRMIEAHHGTIEADSIAGKGTTFTVLLPKKMDFTSKVKFDNITEALSLKSITPDIPLHKISGGYVYSLLSDVINQARPGTALITSLTHINVIAVAAHKKMSAVIFTSGKIPDKLVVERAGKEHIALYVTEASSSDVMGRIYEASAGK